MARSRIGFALGAIACGLLLAYGFYLQYHDGQEPCPLCLVQRGFYFALLFVFLIAAVHGSQSTGTVAYGVAGFVLAVLGGATAGRQVWLQHLPAPKCLPTCCAVPGSARR
jgi:protein dithiol:quinone oxidoreductase